MMYLEKKETIGVIKGDNNEEKFQRWNKYYFISNG